MSVETPLLGGMAQGTQDIEAKEASKVRSLADLSLSLSLSSLPSNAIRICTTFIDYLTNIVSDNDDKVYSLTKVFCL